MGRRLGLLAHRVFTRLPDELGLIKWDYLMSACRRVQKGTATTPISDFFIVVGG